MTYTPDKLPILVKIDGVNVGSYVNLLQNDVRMLPGLTISQEMGEAYDEMTLAMINAASLGLMGWQEVVVSNLAETERYFGGYIQGIEDQEFGTALDYILTVVDYTIDLEKSVINLKWEDETDAAILAEIRTACVPPLTDFDFSTHVSSLKTLESFPARRLTVREALDKLATLVGANWYVDYDKNLRWFSDEDVRADFSLSDAPDFTNSFPYQYFEKNEEDVEVLNRITVVGGHYLSGNIVDDYAGDGEQVKFVVPNYYHKQTGETGVVVEINTGTDASPVWTAATVGVKYIDSLSDYDVLFAFEEKFFEFGTAPGDLKKAWRVKARYEAPLRVRVRSMPSYERYGRWFEGVLVNPDLEDKESARLYGRQALAENALGRTVYRATTDTPGLRAGMVVGVENSLRGVNDDFLIQRLTRRFLGGGWISDDLELGDYLPDLNRMMLALARRTEQDADYAEDEVLDELLEFFDEITFSGETHSMDTSTGPYTWGPGGSNDFNWGYGKYS